MQAVVVEYFLFEFIFDGILIESQFIHIYFFLLY